MLNMVFRMCTAESQRFTEHEVSLFPQVGAGKRERVLWAEGLRAFLLEN